MEQFHRTKLKVILNPICRKFGFSIVSKFRNEKFIGYQLRKYPQNCPVIGSTTEGETQTELGVRQADDVRVEENREMYD